MAARIAPVHPFAEAAEDLARRGLAVLPCPGADGKSPAGAISGYNNWSRRPGRRMIAKMVEKWSSANIGIITSLSGVTVVDVDSDGDLAEDIMRRIGNTPLIMRTPSGGRHLWYRSNGERNANLRSVGFPVDIKGTGAGIVVVPPSYKRSNRVPYVFECGSWDDLPRLPNASLGKLVPTEGRFESLSDTRQGQRNNRLFKFALREARNCDDMMALLDVVQTVNCQLDEPLPSQETLKIVESAWNYRVTGRNWVGSEARATITGKEIGSLIATANGADALMLYVILFLSHGARSKRGELFAISAHAMASHRVIGFWSAARIRKARDTLLDAGLIRLVKRGGQGKGDTALFCFGPKGNESFPNVIEHPPLGTHTYQGRGHVRGIG